MDTIVMKLLVLGESGVGKSSFVQRFTDDTFTEKFTIAYDFKEKIVEIDQRKVKLHICDTAGMERCHALVRSIYRGVHGVILVYDITDPHTFEKLNSWLQTFHQYATVPELSKMLVANKIDRQPFCKNEMVNESKGVEFAQDHAMLFCQVSARLGDGIQEAFEKLIKNILDIMDKTSNHSYQHTEGSTIKVTEKTTSTDKRDGKKKCGC